MQKLQWLVVIGIDNISFTSSAHKQVTISPKINHLGKKRFYVIYALIVKDRHGLSIRKTVSKTQNCPALQHAAGRRGNFFYSRNKIVAVGNRLCIDSALAEFPFKRLIMRVYAAWLTPTTAARTTPHGECSKQPVAATAITPSSMPNARPTSPVLGRNILFEGLD